MIEETELEQFENILVRLEEIVRQLEGGRLSLNDSLVMYQEAKRLSEKANILLNQAEALMKPEAEA